jgi:hypothetical protein
MTEAVKLARDFTAALRAANLPPKVFAYLFRMDGRSFGSWEFRGVPPELLGPVRWATDNLKSLVRKKVLPKSMNELAYLGLEALSEKFNDDGDDGTVPEEGPSGSW